MARPTKITGVNVTPFSGVKIQKVGAIYTRTLEEGGAIFSEKGVKEKGWGLRMKPAGFPAPNAHGVALSGARTCRLDASRKDRSGGFLRTQNVENLNHSGIFGWIVWWILRQPQPARGCMGMLNRVPGL